MAITHTATRTVTLNGVTEYPASATPIDISGIVLEAEDGTPTAVWLSGKRRWELRWDSPLPAIVNRMRAIYAARANVSFTDPWGASYSVMIPPLGLKYDLNYLPASTNADGTTYPLTVEVWEA